MAFRRSTIFSWRLARLTTKRSFSEAAINRAILRRLSCVFLSASSLADVAPTPNMMPAAVGDVRRESNSGIRSLSARAHERSIGSQPRFTSSCELAKNLASLNASPMSLLENLDASVMPDIAIIRSSVCWLTFSGNVFERRIGPRTCVDIVLLIAATRSDSISILDKFGVIVDRTDTRLSDPRLFRVSSDTRPLPESVAAFSELLAVVVSLENPIGLIVNVAVRRRTKRSYQDQLTATRLRVVTYTELTAPLLMLSERRVTNLFAEKSGKVKQPCQSLSMRHWVCEHVLQKP